MLSKGRKKANIVSIHKKGDKQLIQNYRPVSLLSIYGKIFEKLIFNSSFKYLENNSLLNPHQFLICDSCTHHFLSIAYDIYKSFHANSSIGVGGISQKHMTECGMLKCLDLFG